MTDLVTPAAVEACRRGQGCEDPDGCECAEWIADGLKAAAPFIAAEALRQAASAQRKQYAGGLMSTITANWLELRADELETDVHPTEEPNRGEVMDMQELQNRFAFHPATTDEKRMAHASVRDLCLQLALALNEQLPEGREKSLAITKLEEVMFWGNAGLAREGDDA